MGDAPEVARFRARAQAALAARETGLPVPVEEAGVRAPPTPVRLSDLTPSEPEWLFTSWIPFGALSLVQGDPAVGKTTLVLDLLARATRGEYPRFNSGNEPLTAFLLSSEDQLRTTLIPRLMAAHADLSRVFAEPEEGGFDSIATDLLMLEHYIVSTGARIVMFDPFQAYLGVDMNDEGSIRRTLRPLTALAERHRCAFVGIRHLRKSTDGGSMYRGGGSIGISATARSVIHVGRHPEEPEQLVMASVKSNLGARPGSIAFSLENPYPEDPQHVARVHWHRRVDISADELDRPTRPPTRGQQAELWLRNRLALGPVPEDRLRAEAEAAGLTWRTVSAARRDLGVTVERGEWSHDG